MFNYRKVRNLKIDLDYANDKIKTEEKYAESYLNSITRYVRAAKLATKHLGAVYSGYQGILDAESTTLELDNEYKAERAKIEAIVRDLLKKNVFKEEQK